MTRTADPCTPPVLPLAMFATSQWEDDPAPYPPMGEDAETPWLPTDPLPNPEPPVPALDDADPGIFEGVHAHAAAPPVK